MATAETPVQAAKKHNFAEQLKAKRGAFNKECEILGGCDLKTLATENEIALLYLQTYQYDRALLIFNEVYYKRLAVLGPNNEDTIATQSNIGLIYYRQDRTDEAVNVFHEIYRKRCDILGHKHPNTQGILRTIGLILQKQKNFDEAFEIFNELEDGFTCQEAMARALYKENKYEKALEFFIKIKERVLEKFGQDSPETLTAKHGIGDALSKLARWEEALAVYDEVLEGRKKSLGPLNKDAVSALRDYGVALYKLGNIEEGLDFLRKALVKTKTALGPDHESVLDIYSAIGYILKSESRYNESLQVYQHLLRIRTSKNSDHLETSKIRFIIAEIYEEQGNECKAYEIYSEIYKIGRMNLNRSTLWHKMVSFLSKQGKCLGGLKMHKERYEELKELLGPEHSKTLDAYENLGDMLFSLKEHSEALEIFRDAFAKREVFLGIDHIKTLRTRQRMADALAKQRNYAEATLVYNEVYEVRKAIPFSMYTYYTATNLAGMLCLLGNYENSLLVYEERASMRSKIDNRERNADVEKNIVHTLLKDDTENNSILQSFKNLSEVTVKMRIPGHLSIIETQNAIAEILQAQNKFDEALKVYETVYQLQRTQSSSQCTDDTSVHITKISIAKMYSCVGKFNEAVEILEDVYENLKSALGPEHPDCLDSRLQLAKALSDSNRFDAAISLYLDMYGKRRKKLGPKHPDILDYEQGITTIRLRAPKLKLAEKMMEGDFHSFLACLEENKGSINNQDALGSTALHYASESGRRDFVESLLQSGAFHDVRDKTGRKPLDYASDDDIVNLLYAVNAFFIAVKLGDDESINKLITDSVVLDAKDKDGDTGLHWAVREGHRNIIKTLVDRGADWSVRNEKGEIPIDVAISMGNEEIADILRKRSKTESYLTSNLINENGGNTPLHLAAYKGHLEILQELLSCGADPSGVNDHGYTPLHYAAYEGNTAIVKALLEYLKKTHEKKLNSFINCKNSADGAAALQMASNRGFTETAKLLISYGADDVHS